MVTKTTVQVRRVYDPPAAHDGTRVLVDRIWPRGLTKSKAHLDEWCKEVAPSTELRKWYSHDPARFEEFAHRYHIELHQGTRSDALTHLRELAKGRHPDVAHRHQTARDQRSAGARQDTPPLTSTRRSSGPPTPPAVPQAEGAVRSAV